MKPGQPARVAGGSDVEKDECHGSGIKYIGNFGPEAFWAMLRT